MVASASLLYGTYFGYEPAGVVDDDGIVARVYNAVASGAWNSSTTTTHLEENGGRDTSASRTSCTSGSRCWRSDVLVRTSADLKKHMVLPRRDQPARDLCDLSYVDERMIEDGALANLKMLLWASGPVTEADTAQVIREAVTQGMTLIVPADWRREPLRERTSSLPTASKADVIHKKGSARSLCYPGGQGYVVEAQESTVMSSIESDGWPHNIAQGIRHPPIVERSRDGRTDGQNLRHRHHGRSSSYNHGINHGRSSRPTERYKSLPMLLSLCHVRLPIYLSHLTDSLLIFGLDKPP